MRGYHPRTCVRCGAVMKGTIRRKYCSPKCKVYAYRERKDAAKVLVQSIRVVKPSDFRQGVQQIAQEMKMKAVQDPERVPVAEE